MAYSTTTLATMRGRIRERLLTTFWTDDEINSTINESLRVWNVLTGYFQNQATGVVITGNLDGQSISTFASDCLTPIRITDTVTLRTLSTLDLRELAGMRPFWLSNVGVPTAWVPVGLDHFYVYPNQTASNPLTIDYISKATVPSADTDFIQVGEEDISALIDYCVFIAHLKEGGAEVTSNIALFQNFLKQASKYNSKIAKSLIYARIMGIPMGGQENVRPDVLDQQTSRS